MLILPQTCKRGKHDIEFHSTPTSSRPPAQTLLYLHHNLTMSNLIELLPSASSHATPGWAYVATTTNYNAPSTTMTGRKPSGTRKRPARDTGGGGSGSARARGGGGGGDVSVRQHNATLRHLAELDRENHRDAHIPVVTKRRENAPNKGARSKTTSNVRRILLSQKTFRNYVDDEEAALALGSGFGAGSAAAAAATTTVQRGSVSRSVAVRPSPRGSSGRSTPKAPPSQAATQSAGTPAEGEAEAEAEIETETSAPAPAEHLPPSDLDTHPLLRSYIPTAPAAKIMQQLLSEPPLSYNASRAKLPGSPGGRSRSQPGPVRKPPRRFCGICGFWGRIKCVKCAARVCGLECYRTHEETRCDRFYA